MADLKSRLRQLAAINIATCQQAYEVRADFDRLIGECWEQAAAVRYGRNVPVYNLQKNWVKDRLAWAPKRYPRVRMRARTVNQRAQAVLQLERPEWSTLLSNCGPVAAALQRLEHVLRRARTLQAATEATNVPGGVDGPDGSPAQVVRTTRDGQVLVQIGPFTYPCRIQNRNGTCTGCIRLTSSGRLSVVEGDWYEVVKSQLLAVQRRTQIFPRGQLIPKPSLATRPLDVAQFEASNGLVFSAGEFLDLVRFAAGLRNITDPLLGACVWQLVLEYLHKCDILC